MNIVIFGGTTEGRALSHRLADAGVTVTVCVATPYGEEEQGTRGGVTVLTGRKTAEEMPYFPLVSPNWKVQRKWEQVEHYAKNRTSAPARLKAARPMP